MRIKITADSTCDLSQDLLERYDIGITPLSIVKDNVPYRDGLEITPKDIFAHVDGGGTCNTTAVNAAEYTDVFRACLKTHDAIVHISLGSWLSACNQNANIAAAELDNVYVVDSLNLSVGMGHLVLDAAELAKAGVEPAEIKRRLDEKKSLVDMSFVIDSLDYLHRGGRCSALTMMGANLLSLKPCIEVLPDKMDVGKKYRGQFGKILSTYVQDRLADRDDIDHSSIFLVHTDLPEELLDEARAAIDGCISFKRKYETIAGCTISNHCGPVALGIMFYHK